MATPRRTRPATRSTRSTRPARRRSPGSDIISVYVSSIPGPRQEISLGDDRTVGDAIKAAGFDIDTEGDYEIRVNDDRATLDKKLRAGDIVMLTGDIQGN